MEHLKKDRRMWENCVIGDNERIRKFSGRFRLLEKENNDVKYFLRNTKNLSYIPESFTIYFTVLKAIVCSRKTVYTILSFFL